MDTRTIKAIRTFHKVLDMGRYILLSFFATMFAILGISILLTCELNIFNLIGAGGCLVVAWINWSIRRD